MGAFGAVVQWVNRPLISRLTWVSFPLSSHITVFKNSIDTSPARCTAIAAVRRMEYETNFIQLWL